MKKLRWFIKRLKSLFWLPVQFKDLRLQMEVLKRQNDLLLKANNRKTRRKWFRMLNNPRSPFYVYN